MNIANSSLKIFLARVCKAGFAFIAVIVFSRELGASPLGTYYPFIALLGLIGLPVDLGIGEATEKRISEGGSTESYLGTSLALKAPLVLAVGITLLLAKEYVNRFLGAELTFLLVLTLIVSSMGGTAMAALRGELRVGETAILEVIQPLSWLLIGYFFYTQGYGVRGLVYGFLFGTVLMAVLGWWKVSIPIGRPSMEHARSLIDYGRFSAISSVGGYFYSWSDIGILTLFVTIGSGLTRADIGAYENAWRLSLVVMLVGKSISTTLFPQISQWDADDATEKIESVIPTALLPSLVIVIPAFVGTLLLSRSLLRHLFNPEFTVAWFALIILAGGKIPQSLHILLSQALNGINRPDLAATASIISAVLNFVFNLVLIWQFGIVGAAIATTGSFAINTVLHAHYLNRFLEIRLPLREATWSVVASLVMGVCLYTLRSFVIIDGILPLLALISTSVVVYTVVLLLYSPIRVETTRIIRPLFIHFKSKLIT